MTGLCMQNLLSNDKCDHTFRLVSKDCDALFVCVQVMWKQSLLHPCSSPTSVEIQVSEFVDPLSNTGFGTNNTSVEKR